MSPRRWYLHNLSTGKALLVEGELVVGRTWMTLAHDRGLSRKHFKIRIEERRDSNGAQRPDQVILTDLGSTHGTRINSSLLPPNEEFLVNPTDLILAGHQTFRVHPSAILPDRGISPGKLGLGIGQLSDEQKIDLKLLALRALALLAAVAAAAAFVEHPKSPLAPFFRTVEDFGGK